MIKPGWVLIVPKLVPHLGGVEEIHGALATPSHLKSFYSYKNPPKLIATC